MDDARLAKSVGRAEGGPSVQRAYAAFALEDVLLWEGTSSSWGYKRADPLQAQYPKNLKNAKTYPFGTRFGSKKKYSKNSAG